jgi:hypothetical protein
LINRDSKPGTPGKVIKLTGGAKVASGLLEGSAVLLKFAMPMRSPFASPEKMPLEGVPTVACSAVVPGSVFVHVMVVVVAVMLPPKVKLPIIPADRVAQDVTANNTTKINFPIVFPRIKLFHPP